MATIRFTAETYNVMIAASAIKILVDILTVGLKAQLRTCSFQHTAEKSKLCIPMMTDAVGINCTENVSVHTALQYYYR